MKTNTMTNTEIRTNVRKRKAIKCIEDGQIFNSVKQAAEYYGVYAQNISHVITGRRKHTGNHTFCYVDVEDKHDVVVVVNNEPKPVEFKRHITVQKEATFEAHGRRDNGNCKSILCITDGLPFASMVDAAEYYGITISQISYACKEKGRTAGGKQFCKFEDLYLYIPEINDAINKKNKYTVLIEKENKRKELVNNIRECEESVRYAEAMLVEAKRALELAEIELANFDN